jgi:hypothetical protein
MDLGGTGWGVSDERKWLRTLSDVVFCYYVGNLTTRQYYLFTLSDLKRDSVSLSTLNSAYRNTAA